MRNEYPNPLSDPEAFGVPDVADDESSARDDVETGRDADGPTPVAVPLDRDDRPEAIDQFGTTPEEQREGESLDDKLTRETADPAMRNVDERRDTMRSPIEVEAFAPEPLTEDTDRVDPETLLDDTGPVDPRTDSPVSMYDVPARKTGIGRLVDPDEGIREDTDGTSIARDAGASGGGPSTEEVAVHEVEEF